MTASAGAETVTVAKKLAVSTIEVMRFIEHSPDKN
jgi:hypothetical protein